MESIFKLGILFQAIDRISAPVRGIGGQVDKLRGQVSSLGPQFEKFQTYGKQAAMFGVVLSALLTAPVSSAKNFEYSMSQVGAVSQASGVQLQELEKCALSLGSSTAFSASQVAQGQKYMAMAGMDYQAIISSMPGVLNLASSAQLDLGKTANISTNILSAFGMKASQMGYVGDVLTRTFTSSNTTLESLASAMSNAAPVAHAAGVGLHELSAMAGKMGDVGIDAAVAGTSLKIMIQRLQAPTGKAAETLKALGIVTQDAAGNMLPLFSILGQLEKSTAGMGSAVKASQLKEIFGEEAIGGITAILQTGIKTIADYSNTLATGPVTSAMVATTQMDNMHGAMTTLKSASEGLSIIIGKQLLPVLIPLLLMFASGIQKLTAFATEHKTLTRIIVIGAGSFAVLAIILGGLAATLGTLAIVTPVLGSGFMVAIPVIGAICASIAIARSEISALIIRFKDASSVLLSFALISGQELLRKMASGVMIAGKALILALYKVFMGVRAMLPFSDAKAGPLSSLTLCGQKIIITIAQGVKQSAPLLVSKVRLIFQKIRLLFVRFNTMLASIPVMNWIINHMGTIGGVLGKLAGRFNQTGVSAARNSGFIARFGRVLMWLLGPVKMIIAAGSMFYWAWSNNILQIQDRISQLKEKISGIDFSNLISGNISISLPEGITKFFDGIKTFFYGMGVELVRLCKIISALLGPVVQWIGDAFQSLFALFSGDGQSSMEGLGRAIIILLGLPLEALALTIRAVSIPVSILVDSLLSFAGMIKNIENPLIKWGVVLGIALGAIKALVAFTSIATVKTIAFSTATGLLSASQVLLYPYSFLIAKGMNLFNANVTTAIVKTRIITAVQTAWAGVVSGFTIVFGRLNSLFTLMITNVNLAAIKFRVLSIAQSIWAGTATFLSTATGIMAGAFNTLTAAMAANPIGAIVVGFVVAAGLLIRYWKQISEFFSSLNLFESGKKIVSTLVNGILAMSMAPYNAIKKIFTKVRELLPFSDAKTGPFSKLTLSGKRIITTLSNGAASGTSVFFSRMRLFGKRSIDTFIYYFRRGGLRIASVLAGVIPAGMLSKTSSFFITILKVGVFVAKRFLGPIGIILSAISMIHTLFKLNFLGIKQAWSALTTGIGEGMKAAWQEIKAVFSPVVSAFKEAFAPLGVVFNYIKELIFGVNSEFTWLNVLGKTIGYAIVIPFKALAIAIRAALYPLELLFNGIARINQFVADLNLFESGRKLILSFVEGIKSVIMAPVNIVKNVLSKIRNYLPFSDAKEGPLSNLTLSGSRVLTTMSLGVQQGAPTLQKGVHDALGKLNIPSVNIPFMNDFSDVSMDTVKPERMSIVPQLIEKINKDKEKQSIVNNFYVQNVNLEGVNDVDNLMYQLQQRLVVYDG